MEDQQIINNYAKLKQKIIETAEAYDLDVIGHVELAEFIKELAEEIKSWDVD